ncbi:RICIN domain-containing protein [Streptomyces sp. NPDC013178]|uniref:RICIN domain-containing protein n=1 Tax=Streptomyces sp. NPDC013178 TaxID=3155118 RepID=UPI0033D71F85
MTTGVIALAVLSVCVTAFEFTDSAGQDGASTTVRSDDRGTFRLPPSAPPSAPSSSPVREGSRPDDDRGGRSRPLDDASTGPASSRSGDPSAPATADGRVLGPAPSRTAVVADTPEPTGATRPAGFPDSIVSAAGTCLAKGSDTGSGGRSLALAPCDGSAGRTWRHTADGSVRNAEGDWCLDIVDARTESGSTVQLFACNTTPAQTWRHNGGGQLLNPRSGRCLDAGSLSIEDCDGSALQRWRLT